MLGKVSYDDELVEAIASLYYGLSAEVLALHREMDDALENAQYISDEIKVFGARAEKIESFLWRCGYDVNAPVVITEEELIAEITKSEENVENDGH